jgi:hypothetical protein
MNNLNFYCDSIILKVERGVLPDFEVQEEKQTFAEVEEVTWIFFSFQ